MMPPRDAPTETRQEPGPIDRLGGEGQPSSVEPVVRQDIGEAFRQGRIEIWYQPKIDLKRKRLAGAEAQASVRHPQSDVILPAGSLPGVSEDDAAQLAEHALIATLHDWSMFEQAGFNLHLGINMPVSVLFRLPMAEIVETHRPNSQRWPGIILEVTEDQVVRNVAQAKEVADRLRASGIKISIDEFGAGYSSLSSLRELPFVEIKLDESFVRNCATDPTNAAICQTAIDLAHRFGSAAVAEGIDSQADLQALMVMGCDFGQGALIGPSMPRERFLELLNHRSGKPLTPAEAADPAAAPLHGSGVGRVA